MVGFTTSIPVEVIFAANLKPVDLNNIFITCESPNHSIECAEKIGFPRNTCSWIKGIYSAIKNDGTINKVIDVIAGDCSNSKALMEVLEYEGVECIAFSYPANKDYKTLYDEIHRLCEYFHVNIHQCNDVKKDLIPIRENLKYYDELTWKYNKVKGFQNHFWLVSASDFFGDYKLFNEKLLKEIAIAEGNDELKEDVRIGYIGVPPIYSDIYECVEGLNARIVYNEIQRQFTLYDSNKEKDIVKSYLDFTYPYNLKDRLVDIKQQIKLRKIDAIIHYTQAFCFRAIEDILIRKELGVPVLTIEGDRPGKIDPRTKLRLEAFIDMVRE